MDEDIFRPLVADWDRVLDKLNDMDTGRIKRIKADDMFRYCGSRVIGQDRAISEICKGFARQSAMCERGKPLYTAMLLGKTSVGKTEFVKAATGFVYGDESRMLTIDCTNLGGSSQQAISNLVGDKAVYSGASRGELCEFVSRYPDGAMINLQELEKADKQVSLVLLTPLDEGWVKSNYDGRTYRCDNHGFIATSNEKAQELVDALEGIEDADERRHVIKEILCDTWPPEFLARWKTIAVFEHLRPEHIAKIGLLNIRKLCNKFGIRLAHEGIAEEVVLEVVRRNSKKNTREMIGWLETEISDGLMDAKDAGAREVRINLTDVSGRSSLIVVPVLED